MRWPFREIVVGVLTVLLLPVCAECAIVKGRVINSNNGTPIQNANVGIVGTPITAVSDKDGRFRLDAVGVGEVSLRTWVEGYHPQTTQVRVDSVGEVIDLTIFLKMVARTLVEGCIPEFVEYQSRVSEMVSEDPSSITLRIEESAHRDSFVQPSVVISVINRTSLDLYLLKNYDCGGQVYLVKVTDSTGRIVKSNVSRCEGEGVGFLHAITDVRRVPTGKSIAVDTLSISNILPAGLAPGKYSLQIVYIFPKSRRREQDGSVPFLAPMADESAVGELYCMTLQGRFESNWIHLAVK